MNGSFFISTKQAPTCTLLRKAGNPHLAGTHATLTKLGFNLICCDPETKNEVLVKGLVLEEGSVSSRSTFLSTLLRDVERENQRTPPIAEDVAEDSASNPVDLDETLVAAAEPEFLIAGPKNKKYYWKHDYTDFWKIQAARVLAESRGEPLPKLFVWQCDTFRLQDKIPNRILGPSWSGSKTNSVQFWNIASMEVKLHIIAQHTHWGHRLYADAHHKDSEYHYFMKSLWRRVTHFLAGKPDPNWNARRKERFWGADQSTRSQKSRSLRLLEMLKTVDGIFFQRYLAYPEEMWTWERFDLFTLWNLNTLIGDEFLDGQTEECCLDIVTNYALIKKHRKCLKKHFHENGSKKELDAILKDIPDELRVFSSLAVRIQHDDTSRKPMLIGLISQTRGAGTPPPLVLLQSKRKFLLTVSGEPEVVSATSEQLIRVALEEIISDLPQEAFTGLSTKGRVTVTHAAAWENTRAEGGTTDVINQIVNNARIGQEVPVRNLETNVVESYQKLGELNLGEYIFWACFDQILRYKLDELNYAFITVVKEPGKARAVTKGRTCLKIILDFVNKICSYPLKKGIESSSSGMGASHHGWNFFTSFSDKDKDEILFSVENRTSEEFVSEVEITDTYKDCFMSSTDYEEATDSMDFKIASWIGEAWMRKCGIPRVLRLVVQQTCYKPRRIYFHGVGCLSRIGIGDELDATSRYVVTRKGVLMGDPLTKVVLHILNIIVRRLGEGILDPVFLAKCFTNSNEISGAVKEALSKSKNAIF